MPKCLPYVKNITHISAHRETLIKALTIYIKILQYKIMFDILRLVYTHRRVVWTVHRHV
jgi:hypothetical protein